MAADNSAILSSQGFVDILNLEGVSPEKYEETVKRN